MVELDVNAIIIASGLGLYDISPLVEYGYGEIKDVITGMEFERLTAASGPTMGELRRPSDGRIPETIAFIQCVGSRDLRHKAYCSSVCCMHATKEAILANEHHPNLRSYIFYTDMRAVGKRFQEYIARAEQEYEVTYIRSRPSKIAEKPEDGKLIVCYEETNTRTRTSMEVDMVVLCQALIPSDGQRELSEMLNVELNEYQFVNIPDRLFHPVDTDVPGIFACGFCQSPQDIPDSVVQASAAASRAAEFMSQED
jgi:heterodisulfide reductase subunit A